MIASVPGWMRDPDRKCSGDAAGGFLTATFYPTKNSAVAFAKAICNGLIDGEVCKYRDTCLKTALDNGEEEGVWGGTSERDRARIWKARKKAGKWVSNLEDARFPRRRFVKPQPVRFIKRRVITENIEAEIFHLCVVGEVTELVHEDEPTHLPGI